MSASDWVRALVPSQEARRARAQLRALAAALEERGVAPLPVGALRWHHRRRGLDGEIGDRPLPYRRVHRRAWLARSDDTSETLAVSSGGELWQSSLLETGVPPLPHRPTRLLAGHGPGVKFLSWPGNGIAFAGPPGGPLTASVSVAGWGYEFTDEVSVDRLIAQTLDAYARDPRWPEGQR
ncbi:hypothetical protein [Actinoplanes sp. NPDC049681]|uniref:hypothetical protein n=1 Tax=Actinoplanes sp. NPDC049681 TaxID=3363905 RepID=UPI003793BA5C